MSRLSEIRDWIVIARPEGLGTLRVCVRGTSHPHIAITAAKEKLGVEQLGIHQVMPVDATVEIDAP